MWVRRPAPESGVGLMATATRRAPDEGYDFGTKRAYRRAVWGAFRDVSGDHVALMPSSEGDEIWEAEKRGFDRRRIHVVDQNPAICAHLTRRFPGINTYGVDLRRAIQRMKSSGVKLSAANWDLTCPTGEAAGDILSDTAHAGIVSPGGMVALTVLRGREQPAWFTAIKSLSTDIGGWWRQRVDRVWCGDREPSDTDYGRLGILTYAIGQRCPELVRAASYRSSAGSQTMLYAVWRLDEMARCHAMADKHQAKIKPVVVAIQRANNRVGRAVKEMNKRRRRGEDWRMPSHGHRHMQQLADRAARYEVEVEGWKVRAKSVGRRKVVLFDRVRRAFPRGLYWDYEFIEENDYLGTVNALAAKLELESAMDRAPTITSGPFCQAAEECRAGTL